MDIKEAARELYNSYKEDVWFQTVGIAEPDTLYVYLRKRLPKGFLKLTTFLGFKIIYQYVGEIRVC